EMVARFGEKFEEVLTSLSEKIPAIVEKMREWKEILDPFMPVIKAIATGVVAFVAAVASMNSVIKVAQGVWAVFNAVVFANPITAIIAAFIAGAALIVVYWEPIKEFFSGLWEGIKSVALAIWEPIKEAWNAAVEFLLVISMNSVIKVAQGVWAVFNAVVFANPITAIIAAFIAGAALIVVYWEPIKEFFSGLWEGIKSVALAIWEPIKEAWNAAVEFLLVI